MFFIPSSTQHASVYNIARPAFSGSLTNPGEEGV